MNALLNRIARVVADRRQIRQRPGDSARQTA